MQAFQWHFPMAMLAFENNFNTPKHGVILTFEVSSSALGCENATVAN